MDLAERAGDTELMMQGRLDQVVDLLELGEIEAADAEIEVHRRLAEELRDPVELLWHDAVWATMRALLEGRFEEAQKLADRALALGAPIRGRTAEQYHWTQTFWIRREQGRLRRVRTGAVVTIPGCATDVAHGSRIRLQRARTRGGGPGASSIRPQSRT